MPATFRLPRRSTSQRPCRKSELCGTHSSLSMRTLLTDTPPSLIVRRAETTMMAVALHPHDADQVYGAARNGQIIGTQDAGKSWHEYRLPAGCEDVYGIACG